MINPKNFLNFVPSDLIRTNFNIYQYETHKEV